MTGQNAIDVTPSARRLTTSLRDIGYDPLIAIADIVDNSVAAGARTVDIEVVFDGSRSHLVIADDGHGMTAGELNEALRFGSRRNYDDGELGRYGLGLKTASISQCRRLSVVSRRAPIRRCIVAKTLDLDHIDRTDRWEIIDPPNGSHVGRSLDWLDDGPGTVVIWENLDRLLPVDRPDGGHARRRLVNLATRISTHLGVVFHRFLTGQAERDVPLVITVNGEKVRAWDPFAPLEAGRQELSDVRFEVATGGRHGFVDLRRCILPPRDRFSSLAEFERLAGPRKWNRQQGFYIYRADRLIHAGGWCGLRAIDEHTKLARVALDFPTTLDDLFQINVAKMRVALPSEIRGMLDQPIHELCRRADAVYRSAGNKPPQPTAEDKGDESARAAEHGFDVVSGALMVAALDSGEFAAFERIIERLKDLDPSVAAQLGW